MKYTSMVIDEKLIKKGMIATGIKTRRALVDYALRELLCRESPKRPLELKEKEQKHQEGYRRKPVKCREFLTYDVS
jgi:Arc/MetJ family transcription regulator